MTKVLWYPQNPLSLLKCRKSLALFLCLWSAKEPNPSSLSGWGCEESRIFHLTHTTQKLHLVTSWWFAHIQVWEVLISKFLTLSHHDISPWRKPHVEEYLDPESSVVGSSTEATLFLKVRRTGKKLHEKNILTNKRGRIGCREIEDTDGKRTVFDLR